MKSILFLVLAGLLLPMVAIPMQQSGNTAKESQKTKKNVKSSKQSEPERRNKSKLITYTLLCVNYSMFACAVLGQIYSYARPHSSIAKFGSKGAFADIMVASSVCGLISTIAWALDYVRS